MHIGVSNDSGVVLVAYESVEEMRLAMGRLGAFYEDIKLCGRPIPLDAWRSYFVRTTQASLY